MLKGFKYRIYPNEAQKKLIGAHIAAHRFVYNLALETKQLAWIGSRHNLTCFDLIKQLPDLKKECPWLKKVSSLSLQAPIMNLTAAYNGFFNGLTHFPRFKSEKRAKHSFAVPQNVFIKKGKLVIPKFLSGIKISLHRLPEGEIKRATITKTRTGKYFASLVCETGVEIPIKKDVNSDEIIGLDLGIKYFIATSNGTTVENPKFLKRSEIRLKYLNRKYSKYNGKRTKRKLAILHEKVANQRQDFLHKTSTELIRDNQSIAVESLNVSGMLKNHSLAKSISDASWCSFLTMLKYKANWTGKHVLEIGRFEPSSKTCSTCGSVNNNLKLSDRTWICQKCKSVHNRDINAACNIKLFALKNYLSKDLRFKNHGELPTLVGALTHEALI